MYEAHFGLSARPFSETINPAQYVSLPSRETALLRLQYGLQHGQGPALLFGPTGTGKTLLAGRMARALARRVAHLTFPAMPAAELLALLVAELGIGAPFEPGAPISTSLRRLKSGLASATLDGDRPILVIDEAHLITDPSTFDTLRLLLNFASTGPPDLALLLVGGPEVLLQLPEAFADRLTARALLGPLTQRESAAYVQGRLAAAGAQRALFPADALVALHRAAEGFPRRLNRLADLALLIAYSEGKHEAHANAVAIAARELDPEFAAA